MNYCRVKTGNESVGKPEQIELTTANEAEENMPPVLLLSGNINNTPQNDSADSSAPLTSSLGGMIIVRNTTRKNN
ncbi:hypothetical protein LFLEISCH_10504 [Listeria fleischmannii subsp. fleischmannii LU2006-1]|nr:hypothetical protein LFLEISCH_10504 [Listeria fleischmannii subsp. fleischmannii LU2006-1]